ncbi:putative small proline-rich protein 5 [Ranitomeya imitator]|uniref:putative small proline-rich protein 5 n=1 Tax=Ranitomeya imitator TaxID=111125 RepID=UPI0037E866BF
MSQVKGQKKCPEPEPQCQDPCEPVVQVIEQKCPSPQACEPVVQVIEQKCPSPQACVPEPVCPQPQEVCTQSQQKKDNIGVKK